MKTNLFAIIILFAGLQIACSDQYRQHQLPDLPSGVQAISLLGDTLYTPEIAPEVEEEFRANLEKAIQNYRIDPEDAKNLIWLGRRTAYLGEYRDAVRVFTEGVFKHSEDPRMYRHRGHRYITLRLFDYAISDFEKAEVLMRRMDDIVEPDGLPNELGIPTSTLKSNVWYHLGLAHYVKGEFDKAIRAYENALNLDLTDDMEIATLYWYYMALKRSGQDEKAGEVIAHVTPDIEIIENDAYLELLLVFKGIFDADRLTGAGDDALQNATIGYGLGNWHYINGREERAFEIWQEIYDAGNWPAFGFIAAEGELSREY